MVLAPSDENDTDLMKVASSPSTLPSRTFSTSWDTDSIKLVSTAVRCGSFIELVSVKWNDSCFKRFHALIEVDVMNLL